MEIILNGKEFNFSIESELIPKESRYDLELVEPEFDKKTQEHICGGVDSTLKLPWEIEATVSRTDLLPVARIYKDINGKMRLVAYFD